MNIEKLTKMADSVRTGGKGTVRRKKKAAHKSNAMTEGSRVKRIIQKTGVYKMSEIEEVEIFTEYFVIKFVWPRVLASMDYRTWVVCDNPDSHSKEHCVHHTTLQLGPESRKKTSKQFQKQGPDAGGAAEDDDDDVPDI